MTYVFEKFSTFQIFQYTVKWNPLNFYLLADIISWYYISSTDLMHITPHFWLSLTDIKGILNYVIYRHMKGLTNLMNKLNTPQTSRIYFAISHWI